MESGKLKVKVMEGKVNNVNIVPVDADGNPTGKPGNTPAHIIMREVPFRVRAHMSDPLMIKSLRKGLQLSVQGKVSFLTTWIASSANSR